MRMMQPSCVLFSFPKKPISSITLSDAIFQSSGATSFLASLYHRRHSSYLPLRFMRSVNSEQPVEPLQIRCSTAVGWWGALD